MPNQSLVDLMERTATADTDLVHVNSGGTDYKQTKANFLADYVSEIEFNNTSALTTQVDALPVGSYGGAYTGKIASYGHQSETGVPENDNYTVEVSAFSTQNKRITIMSVLGDKTYTRTKLNGTWGSWILVPRRDEITSLNNSLANKLNNGTLLNPVQGASVNTQGMYCSSKGTLSTAETLTFSTSANRFTALVFITGNDARLAIYYIGFKANSVNEATRIAGSTYSVTCSTSGTISVPVSMWTTVIVMGTAEMT